jgi:Winged helix DNA-binding domain
VAERTLTLRELNRTLLARQLLLRRARLPVPRAIERVGALQAQWPPSPYIALWSRLEGFRPEQLFRAIERRQVVKATLMRVTLHHVSARDYLAYAGLMHRTRTSSVERDLAKDPGEADVERLVGELVRHAAEQPRSRPELLRLLELPRLEVTERRPWLVWYLLASKAGLVHGPSSSVWRRNTAGGTFVPAATWLGAMGSDGDEAVLHLVRRYLAAFGPATRADAAQWTGLPVSVLRPAFEQLRLRRFRDEAGRELFDLPRAPIIPADTEAPPRFLPMWDSSLLAHDDRSRILPQPYRKVVIGRNGDVGQTFLVDGFVAGTWKVEDGEVVVDPFEPLNASARRALEREGRTLAAFHAVAAPR